METEMLRKGLAIIYDPNSLRQFIWYYSTISENTLWDALCLPNGANGMYMDKYCERTGIFSKIYSGNTDYLRMPFLKKLFLFFRFAAYYLFKKQHILARTILNQYVDDIEGYDEYTANIDTGLVSGLLAQFGPEKKVIYFEDGIWDYRPRSSWKSTYRVFSSEYWQGFFMARMGYCAKGRFYFEPTKNCIKYCTSVKKMKYLNYKAMYEFDFSNTDINLYNSIIRKAYPELEKYDFENIDRVVFTERIEDFTSTPDKYTRLIEKYVADNSGSVLLKKHPRDTAIYKFENIESIELNQSLPAEIILPYLKGKTLIFFLACSVLLSISDREYDIIVLYFDELGISKDSATVRKYYSSENELRKELRDVNCDQVTIVHL